MIYKNAESRADGNAIPLFRQDGIWRGGATAELAVVQTACLGIRTKTDYFFAACFFLRSASLSLYAAMTPAGSSLKASRHPLQQT